uniref:PHM7_ext domain-containing protein n=1 Tax=Angiostrongylus cantonensis TaxID=6313 RepID=A0A158P9E5_ANGCA
MLGPAQPVKMDHTSIQVGDREIKVLETTFARHALRALKNYVAEHSGKSLFPEIDHAVGLTVVYKKPALTTNRARLKILLPSPHRTPQNTLVCIIMPDLDQSASARNDPDVDKQARQWAEKIEKDHGLTNQHYAKIMTKRQLEREYHSFSQRRALTTMYDVFLVDVRVGKAVRSFLGKDFYKVHKWPLDFNYSKPLVTTIEQAVKTTVMKLQRYATRMYVSLCIISFLVIRGIVTWCPGGFLNIRSIYVQPVGSTPSLPVYMDDAVRRNGKIRVLKEDTGASVYYPTVHDEWEEGDTLKPLLNPERLRRKQAVKKRRSVRLCNSHFSVIYATFDLYLLFHVYSFVFS